MLGWMILFALITILAVIMSLANAASVSALVGLMFGVLFFLGLVTRLVRGRSW
jgi:uncharacterized protein (DUF58 family)